jgi:uncharacterized protein DUF3501
MPQIARDSLMTLEAYSRARAQFRARVMAHKKQRTLHVGPDVTLVFEDELTIRYQIQEMLRVERIFEEEGIAQELSAYNPLVPDGSNWKATMMIEYPDPALRARRLAELIGIEDRTWVRVRGFDRVFAIADEDLDRETDTKTSAVHFLRFELSAAMKDALKGGAELAIGIDHPKYRHEVSPVPGPVQDSLVGDLA